MILEKRYFNRVMHLVDQGFINDAENQLYDFTQNPENMESLKTALSTYQDIIDT